MAEEKKKGRYFPKKADGKSSGLIRHKSSTGMPAGSYNL